MLPRVRTDTAAGKCGVKDQVSTRSPFSSTSTTGRVNHDMSVFQKILKAGEGKRVRQLAELVGPINELSGQMAALTDAELRAMTDVFRERIAEGETLDDLLIEAFAVVREA